MLPLLSLLLYGKRLQCSLLFVDEWYNRVIVRTQPTSTSYAADVLISPSSEIHWRDEAAKENPHQSEHPTSRSVLQRNPQCYILPSRILLDAYGRQSSNPIAGCSHRLRYIPTQDLRPQRASCVAFHEIPSSSVQHELERG